MGDAASSPREGPTKSCKGWKKLEPDQIEFTPPIAILALEVQVGEEPASPKPKP